MTPDRRRGAGAAAVLASWLLVAAGVVLPAPVDFQHDALVAVTLCSALVTIGASLRRRSERAAWLLLGLGLLGYAGGFIIQFFLTAGERGGPLGVNLSDCSALLLYPLADAGLLLLARRPAGRQGAGSMIEGGMVFMGASAVVVALVAVEYPSLLEGGLVRVVYALAYPVGGFTLLVVTLTGLSLTGHRVDRVWVLLLSGFAVMTVGDALYGRATARGGFRYGTYLDVLYTAGPVFVALAASTAPALRAAGARQLRASSLLPATATLIALAVLVAGSYTMVPMVAVWASCLTVVLAVWRTTQLFAQGRALDRVRAQARTDELTGLANRRALLEALEASTLGEPPSAERPLELLLLDLDGFKEVNDSLGHGAGDDFLTLLGGQLRAAAPGCVVARLGGDEFAVVLPRVRRVQGAPHAGPTLAATLRTVAETPVLLLTTRVVVGVSIGHAVLDGGQPAPDAPGTSVADELLRRADVALYRAKRDHQGCETWEPGLEQGSRDRLALLGQLRSALRESDEIQAWFQPKVDPRDLRVVGYEALVRWQHPTRGLLLPGEFLHAAERAGLLPELTLRLLDRAIAFLAGLLDMRVARRGQPGRTRPARRALPGVGGAAVRSVRRAAVAVAAGDHGDRGDARPGADHRDPADPESPRRRSVPRRLRHRAVQPRLPAGATRGRAQDRPDLREGHAHGPREPTHRLLDDPARPRP